MEAIIARPPQLVVTSAARNVVLTRSREPARLLRMYRRGECQTPGDAGRKRAIQSASEHALGTAQEPHDHAVGRRAEDRRHASAAKTLQGYGAPRGASARQMFPVL